MRLGMQIAFGCVHRKTASTGLGYLVHNSFLKLTLMGYAAKQHLPGLGNATVIFLKLTPMVHRYNKSPIKHFLRSIYIFCVVSTFFACPQ